MAEERKWTDAQRSAIETPGRSLLVTAAAGSGKTAVLTERVTRSLTDEKSGTNAARILVVTFTRAAAGELRTRISAALTKKLAECADADEKRRLARQLMMLGEANISTIDAFSIDLVRSNFQKTDLSATFRITDDAEMAPLRRECMRAVADEIAADPAYKDLTDAFSDIRSETRLTENLLAACSRLSQYTRFLDTLTDSARILRQKGGSPFETPFGAPVREVLGRLAEDTEAVFGDLESSIPDGDEKMEKKYRGACREYRARAAELGAALAANDTAGVCEVLARTPQSDIGRQQVKPADPALDTLARSVVARWKNSKEGDGPAFTFLHFTPEEAAGTAERTAALLEQLREVLQKYLDRYNEIKRQRDVCEFSDVARAAYRLLVGEDGEPTKTALEVREQFDAVYIDEYQDVNEMQDATFRAISREDNRFMVGDIKQSIYRFRGAQPAVFARYRREFPALPAATKGDKGAMITMSECFRCDEPVIDFTNAVAGYLFTKTANSIGGYGPADDLHFSKDESKRVTPALPVQVWITAKDAGKKTDGEAGDAASVKAKVEKTARAFDAETAMIAREIARLIEGGEKKADGTPIRAKDIAVIARSSKFLKQLGKALAALNVPAKDGSNRNFFENPEVLCVYSFLAVIDNPCRDIYLAAVLRSPFFGFTLEDLVTARAAGDRALSLYEAIEAAAQDEKPENAALAARCAAFVAQLEKYRQMAEQLPVDRLLRELYRDTAVQAFLGEREGDNPHLRRANLWRLYEYARSFEAAGYKGLCAFVRYVEGIFENETKMPATDGDPDAVTLMTVHISKGLEYPVCFVVNCGKPFNTDDLKPNFLSDEKLGCALRVSNAGAFSRADTFWREALELELSRQSREEEIRVLYVAITRARERLYVTGSTGQSRPDKLLEDAVVSAHPLAGAQSTAGNCWMKWILTALAAAGEGNYRRFCELKFVPESDVPDLDAALPRESVSAADPAAVERNKAELRKRWDFTYPYAHLARLPAKLSVSRLSPQALDVFDADSTPADPTDDAKERLLHTFAHVPHFAAKKGEIEKSLRGEQAAARGTATHEFLQFCDFARAASEGVAAELARLTEAGFLPREAEELVRTDELERFFASDFYADLTAAREVHRETRFHIFLPAARFTADETFAGQLEGEKLLVQGVIDLFFTDKEGRLTLCDYKTDRLTEAELADEQKAAAMLTERHGKQLSYYAAALRAVCGRRPDRVAIYSLPLGKALDIPVEEI